MVAIDPDLVESLQMTGLATDPDGLLTPEPYTTLAINDITDENVGTLKHTNITNIRGVKATWDVGHGDLKDGDTISIFLTFFGQFPPTNGDAFVCMPYITAPPAATVDSTPDNWLEVLNPTVNAFNVFTMTTPFRDALVDLGSGKFSVRIVINDPVAITNFRFGRWSEVDSNLSQPAGGIVVTGESSLEGVAIVDAFGRFVRGDTSDITGAAVVTASGIRQRRGGTPSVVGAAVVTVQGGVKFDGGTTDPVGEAVVTATGSIIRGGAPSIVGEATVTAVGEVIGQATGSSSMLGQAVVTSVGGIIFKSSVVSIPGAAVVTSTGGVKLDGGTATITGASTVTATGGVVFKSSVVTIAGAAVVTATGTFGIDPEIDGDTTFLLEFFGDSISAISDGSNWWII